MASTAAQALRRKYQRQRLRARGKDPRNSSVCWSETSRGPLDQKPLKSKSRPGIRHPQANSESNRGRKAGSSQQLSSFSNGSPCSPSRVFSPSASFSQSNQRIVPPQPSSSVFNSSYGMSELNQTYMLPASPNSTLAAHRHSVAHHQTEKDHKVQPANCHVLSHLASQPVAPVGIEEDYPRVLILSPRRKRLENSLSSPFKADLSHATHQSPLNSSVHMKSSPSKLQDLLSPIKAVRSAQHNISQETFDSSPNQQDPRWLALVKGNIKTRSLHSNRRSSLDRAVLERDVQSNVDPHEESILSSHSPMPFVRRDASSNRAPKWSASPNKKSFVVVESSPSNFPSKLGPMNHMGSPHRRASLPRIPAMITSSSSQLHPSQRQQQRELQENSKPFLSRSKALAMCQSTLSSSQDPREAADRRRSSIQRINMQFQQLYHQSICQRRLSSSSGHGHSCCLCQQQSKTLSPATRAVPAHATSKASASPSHSARLAAALSLTPVRRHHPHRHRSSQSGQKSLLKHIHRSKQTPPWQRSEHKQYHVPLDGKDEASESSQMFDEEDLSTVMCQPVQTNSSKLNHDKGSFCYSSSSTSLSALRIAMAQHRFAKRRSLSEPQESPSLKRFRENVEALSPSKPQGYAPQPHYQYVWEEEDSSDGSSDACDTKTLVGTEPLEDSHSRSTTLLLQCPSPRFLRAAMKLTKRENTQHQLHATTRARQKHMLPEAEGSQQHPWDGSGMSFPSGSRRQLQYGVPRY